MIKKMLLEAEFFLWFSYFILGSLLELWLFIYWNMWNLNVETVKLVARLGTYATCRIYAWDIVRIDSILGYWQSYATWCTSDYAWSHTTY